MIISETIFLATMAFAGANITDFFVLVTFFSKESFRTREIVIGQYVGVGSLIALCLAIALIAVSSVPAHWTKALGVVPIFVGLKNCFRLV